MNSSVPLRPIAPRIATANVGEVSVITTVVSSGPTIQIVSWAIASIE